MMPTQGGWTPSFWRFTAILGVWSLAPGNIAPNSVSVFTWCALCVSLCPKSPFLIKIIRN